MSIRKITTINVVLLLVVALNSLVAADEVFVSKNNDVRSIDLGTVLPGGTRDLTIKLDESSNCSSIKGSVTDASEKDGWVGGGEGQSIPVTFYAKEDDSGVHTGLIKGKFKGCPEDGDDGGSDWDVTATADVSSVEIQVNNTKKDKDDLVQRKCETPENTFKTECRIRKATEGNSSNDLTVTLSSKNNRVGFTKTNITLPGDGEWKKFKIKGLEKSESLDDARIFAKDSTGEKVGEEDVTVLWFDKSRMQVSKGALNYTTVSGSGTVTLFSSGSEPVANFSAEANLKPQGIDCSQPPVSDLKVGIVQNVTSDNSAEYDNPQVNWTNNAKEGQTITVSSRVTDSIDLDQHPDSIDPRYQPLYDKKKSAVNPPNNCANASASTSSDSPSLPVQKTEKFDLFDSNGNLIATVTYEIDRMVMDNKFFTWSVIYNNKTDDICALKQQEWDLDVTELIGISVSTSENFSLSGGQTDPDVTPKTGTPTANQVFNNPKKYPNFFDSDPSLLTTSFTK